MSFTGIPREKGTLKLPVEEIEILRFPPKYTPASITLPYDDANRPALLFDFNEVLCAQWQFVEGGPPPPDLESTAFESIEDSSGRLMAPLFSVLVF